MNGLGKIQSELQTTLEETQKELRAKKNDMDVLVKQMIRMEENERALRLELESMKAEGTPAEECKTPNQKSSKALPLAPSPLLNQTEGKKTTTASRLMAPLNTDKTPPSRIMKRSNSASAFSRNNSTTGVSPVESFNDVKNADGHRVITSRGSGGSHGSNNNPFNRTNSSRSKYTQYQSSALDKNKNSADRAGAKLSDSVNLKSASGATPRRRVLSPTAGSRKPNTATGGASFVRTPSGYQRIDSAAATPEKATPIRN
ncbi:hypothetical protein ADEAN_000857000 [Angomonas deanei]|uniref:Uncharacterized protein n=1 Tax=Angomonas deanei TaxID=59799 RepID=A0A7G2CRB2_9TRYP|nr:hypothetical protein ADEAN_000857000 [Angomonas deanei]